MNALTGFGIRLEPLSPERAELIRNWRNSPEVSRFMEFQEFITPEKHKAWMSSLAEKPVVYFVIQAKETPIGLIHLAHIDKEQGSAEAGLFIGDLRFMGTGVALGASILLLDFAFGALGLNTVRAKIHQDNQSSQDYNRLLGFKPVAELSKNSFRFWELSAADFFGQRNKLCSLISAIAW